MELSVKFLLVLLTLFLYLELLYRLRWNFFLLPTLHMSVSLVMNFGIIFLADFGKVEDCHLVLLYFLYVFFFSLGCRLYNSHRLLNLKKSFTAKAIVNITSNDAVRVNTFLLSSIFLTLLYFYFVGSNIVIIFLTNYTVDDFSTTRLSFYSGDEYFAPGYFNQFKNVILPLFSTIYVLSKKRSKIIIVVLFLINLLALLGTGQRAFLLHAALFVIILFVNMNLLSVRRVILFFTSVSLVFVLFSGLYQVKESSNIGDFFSQSLSKAAERIFYVEQEGLLFSHRVMYHKEIPIMQEWYREIFRIFPGVEKPYLQHELFALKHGTDRGTEGYSPLSGVMYNLSSFFVVPFALLLGLTYMYIQSRVFRANKTFLHIGVYSFLILHLAIFVTGGPGTLMNNGVLTLFIIILIFKFRLYSALDTSSANYIKTG